MVKDLVSLQEQLDTITNENPKNSPGDEFVMRHDQEDSSRKSEDDMSSESSNKSTRLVYRTRLKEVQTQRGQNIRRQI